MSGNQFKTFALMAAIIALFMLIGGVIGGKGGMLMALIFGGAMNFLLTGIQLIWCFGCIMHRKLAHIMLQIYIKW